MMEKIESLKSGSVTGKQILSTETIKMLEILAGGIAHDYNNVLTVLLGNLSLARSYSDINEEIMEIFLDIEKAAIAAREMTESLLVFSKISALVLKQGSLSEIIKKVISRIFMDNTSEFSIRAAENLWKIEFDEIKMELAFRNIFSFLKTEFQKNMRLQITIENYADNAGRWQQITITDHNLVILNDKISDLIKPGFSVKKTDYGMGLVTAYSIVQKHQGVFYITSHGDSGTSFQIMLPVQEEQGITGY